MESTRHVCARLVLAALALSPAAASAMGLTFGSTSSTPTTTTPTTATTSAPTAPFMNGVGPFGDPLTGPHRMALAPEGRFYVVDGDGGFHVLTSLGASMGPVVLPEPALAVAASPGAAWVSTVGGRILRVDPEAAKVVGAIDVGYASGPAGLAFDPGSGLLWLAERGAGQVRAIRTDGTTVATVTTAGGQALDGVTDVVFDGSAALLWAVRDYDPGQPMAVAIDARTGAFVKSVFVGGTGSDQVIRAGGIAVDGGGHVFLSDAFLGRVQVASAAGTYVGWIGAFGSAPGQLREPAGVLALPGGDLLVANSDDGRLERFGSGGPIQACPGDSDCDGMPDWWELAHGLDPHWAGDALLDYDHDGLTNLQEFRLGTDPRNPDTDGDGVSDGDEVAAGTNPLVDDRRPVLTAGSPADSGPGLVRWSSSLTGVRGSCAVAWTQVGGASVTLRGATSFAPSFVGRKAGDYQFRGVATCGTRSSDPVTVAARILDVAPRAEAGRTVVVHAGRPFSLDGRFSSDANGDPLSLRWDQTQGRPVVASTAGAALKGSAEEPGLLVFTLTATEAGGALSGAADVQVLVVDSDPERPAVLPGTSPAAPAGDLPVAAIAPVASPVAIGAPITLDGTASTGSALVHAWRQVSGPPAGLTDADRAVATVVPFAAGSLVFEHTVQSGAATSLPVQVRFEASGPGATVPKAVALARQGREEQIVLDGTGSGPGPLRYRWTQVGGPWVALDGANAPMATFRPERGAVYAFELEVDDGATRSSPSRVTVEGNKP